MEVVLFNVTATTEIYTYGHTLSLHEALPISAANASASISRASSTLPCATCSRPIRIRTGTASGLTRGRSTRSEEHTSELQSLMRISYAVFCLKKHNQQKQKKYRQQ